MAFPCFVALTGVSGCLSQFYALLCVLCDDICLLCVIGSTVLGSRLGPVLTPGTYEKYNKNLTMADKITTPR